MKILSSLIIVLAFLSCGEKAHLVTAASTQTATSQPTKQVAQASAAPRATPVNNTQSDYKPKNEGWHVELGKAYAESKSTGKPIMANFTGSDWCGWCKRLDRSVFHQDEFKSWASDNVVLLELDFPKRFRLPENIAQQNRGLQQSLGVRGYPTIWLFDINQDDAGQMNIIALGKTGYTKTLGEFQSTIENFIAKRS
ncbi:MAG: thiol:disulfide interchange protein [Saprospiraceae bacterium]|jgi:thiol:disulfide interchange protein